MPVTTPQFVLADRIIGGNLEDILRDFDDAGLSPQAISRRLYAEHQLEISANTLVAWLNKIKDVAQDGAA